jgi:hypothetical protein
MKSNAISFLHKNTFNFGNRKIHQYVIFECKWLFSIVIFHFVKSDNFQDRFHTHAFNALSFKLFGRYREYVLDDESTGEITTIERTQFIRYFPRDSYHCIGESPRGCVTLLIAGPWKKTWKEYINGEVKEYTWNREQIN